MQPKYYKLDIKQKAREKNVEIYRKSTGNFSIPEDKQYLTLCNLQPPDCDGTEIVQLKKLGLIISDSQFYGIDYDEKIIAQNKEWHPNANWIYGYWEDAIRSIDNFDPSLIYLDMTSFVCTKKVIHTVASTLHMCKKKTVLLVNLMANDPQSSRMFDDTIFTNNLPKAVVPSEMFKWRSEVPVYTYNATGKTEMITFVFYKERN